LGTIEVLLLLVQWHPRSLHVPPAGDGWDSEILLTVKNDRDDRSIDVDGPSRSSWKEDVIKPAKRSDQMSWVVLGCASYLMMEVALPSGDNDGKNVHNSGGYAKILQARRLPILRLICLFQEQLASRLGNHTIKNRGLESHHDVDKPANPNTEKYAHNWERLMHALEDLTKLERSIAHTIFPSCVITRHLLQSERYLGMIDHFRPLLSDWQRRFLKTSSKA
jgi:hypothetical protein